MNFGMSGKTVTKPTTSEKMPEFSNQLEETEYWRSKCENKEKELVELEESFTDFQQSSKDLEHEMERELTANEKKLKDLTSTYHRLKSEHEEMVEKSRRIAEDSGKMIHNLQEELDTLKKSNLELRKEKQKLEQDNDELERRVRESEASLQDLTEKMNKTLEENSFLQTELEETKTRSQEAQQRIKDEIRDLKLELSLERASKVDTPNKGKEVRVVPTANTNGQKTPPSPNAKSPRSTDGSIDLVDDILLLVKDMERKLKSQGVPATPLILDEQEEY